MSSSLQGFHTFSFTCISYLMSHGTYQLNCSNEHLNHAVIGNKQFVLIKVHCIFINHWRSQIQKCYKQDKYKQVITGEEQQLRKRTLLKLKHLWQGFNWEYIDTHFKIKMSDRNFTRCDVVMTSLLRDKKITVQQCYICRGQEKQLISFISVVIFCEKGPVGD